MTILLKVAFFLLVAQSTRRVFSKEVSKNKVKNDDVISTHKVLDRENKNTQTNDHVINEKKGRFPLKTATPAGKLFWAWYKHQQSHKSIQKRKIINLPGKNVVVKAYRNLAPGNRIKRSMKIAARRPYFRTHYSSKSTKKKDKRKVLNYVKKRFNDIEINKQSEKEHHGLIDQGITSSFNNQDIQIEAKKLTKQDDGNVWSNRHIFKNMESDSNKTKDGGHYYDDDVDSHGTRCYGGILMCLTENYILINKTYNINQSHKKQDNGKTRHNKI